MKDSLGGATARKPGGVVFWSSEFERTYRVNGPVIRAPIGCGQTNLKARIGARAAGIGRIISSVYDPCKEMIVTLTKTRKPALPKSTDMPGMTPSRYRTGGHERGD